VRRKNTMRERERRSDKAEMGIREAERRCKKGKGTK
jgi:hypothetical protein